MSPLARTKPVLVARSWTFTYIYIFKIWSVEGVQLFRRGSCATYPTWRLCNLFVSALYVSIQICPFFDLVWYLYFCFVAPGMSTLWSGAVVLHIDVQRTHDDQLYCIFFCLSIFSSIDVAHFASGSSWVFGWQYGIVSLINSLLMVNASQHGELVPVLLLWHHASH